MPNRPRELPTIYFDTDCFYIGTRLQEFRQQDAPHNQIRFDDMDELMDDSILLLYDCNTKNSYRHTASDKPLPKNVLLLRLPPIKFLDPVGLALWGKLKENTFIRKGTVFFTLPDKEIKETYGIKEQIKRATPHFGSYDNELKENKFPTRKKIITMEANRRFGFKEAKEQIEMTTYLDSLGCRPFSQTGSDFWYFSPFHDEHTPSFKVDRGHQIWYDHSIGVGGDLVDFVLKYYQCSYSEALQKLKDFLAFLPQSTTKQQTISTKKMTGNIKAGKKIHIVAERPIFKYYLKSYLRERCIPFSLAIRYVSEVDFTNDSSKENKVYTALGFKNNDGGYELRSKNFKASSAPKAPTLITNMTIGETMAQQKSRQSLAVFEGFFNFLSFQELWYLRRIDLPLPDNYLILNSLSFFRKNLDMMDEYGERMLFLDADAAGRSATAEALSRSNSYSDYSHLYDGCEDLNKLLVRQQRPGNDREQGHSLRR